MSYIKSRQFTSTFFECQWLNIMWVVRFPDFFYLLPYNHKKQWSVIYCFLRSFIRYYIFIQYMLQCKWPENVTITYIQTLNNWWLTKIRFVRFIGKTNLHVIKYKIKIKRVYRMWQLNLSLILSCKKFDYSWNLFFQI